MPPLPTRGRRPELPGTATVVVGNGVAGFACASRLAELDEPVAMIGPGLPHDRPPLSKRALATGRLPVLADAATLEARGIHHLDGVVIAVDPANRMLRFAPSGGGADVTFSVPRIVWATGLRYPRPPLAGMDAADENCTAAGLHALVPKLERDGRQVVVVGAGLIGTETAATLSRRHDVTLLDTNERPLARFLPRVSELAADTLAELGVRFAGACLIERVVADGGRHLVETATHGTLPADVVVSAAGFRSSLPAELAPAPQLALSTDGLLQVEGYPGLFACGDCINFPHPRYGRIGIPHWDHARASGRHVAEVIAGATESAYSREPYFFSDIGPLRIQQVGLAAAAADWRDEDGLLVGRDAEQRVACVAFIDSPARLGEARALVAAG